MLVQHSAAEGVANPWLEADDGRRLVSPDLWFDDVGLAVMVHSRAHHLRDEDWEGTIESDGRLAEYGVIVPAFTPRTIQRGPEDVVARIERVYRAALASGRSRPAIRMVPRGDGLPR